MNFFKKNKEEGKFSSKSIDDNNWFQAGGQLVVDVYKEKDNLIVRAPIAGVKTEDITIVVENEILKISGRRDTFKTEEDISYFVKECYWGQFSKEIVLPLEVDGQRTKAKILNGILIVSMPIIEKDEFNKVRVE